MISKLASLSNSRVHLAPMVGLSHFAVREALASFLSSGQRALWPTEMLSSRRLPHQRENEVPEIIFHDKARGLCPQLLGNEERFIRDSIWRLEDWGAQAIDINMGCPVKKALQHNYGVALMGDPDYAAEVVGMAVRATDLPVSVKLRAGLQKDNEFLVSFGKALEAAGAAWITLHPRLAEDGRRGVADWSQIALLKRQLGIPVIGNGDVQTRGDVERMIEETGCDKVMVGRALLAKPWLLSEAPAVEDASQSYGRFLKKVLSQSREHYSEALGLRKLRFLLYHSCVWVEFGHFLYAQIKNAQTYAQVAQILESFFEVPRKVFEHTELRH
jgi:nifR3 family TIM-barrel protein